MHDYRYQPAVREYYAMLSKEASDLSFIVANNEFPVAVCPLTVENIEGRAQASLSGGDFLPLPLFHPKLGPKQLRGLETFIFEEALRRLKSADARRWLMGANPLSAGTDALEDLLPARLGALDVSIQCHVMDLTQTDEDLWIQLRHSAKSTINQGLKAYEFKVYDRTSYAPEIGDRHRFLHHKCAGRVTRPQATFEKMYSWIAEDCGLMFEQLHAGKTVQMIFVALGKDTAYGASAADDPDFQPPVPITHPMNFFIYKETQRRGVKYYEVGETTFRDGLFRTRTLKEKTICDFKRGFGRQTLPHKRWIWFEGPEEEIVFLEERLELYKKHLAEAPELGPKTKSS